MKNTSAREHRPIPLPTEPVENSLAKLSPEQIAEEQRNLSEVLHRSQQWLGLTPTLPKIDRDSLKLDK